jgi:acetyl-CoA/propionyl-CoA/long-chain acyl-CoA carboxylase, biotin carboxylase, biotin carboxyl carrier protein
VVLRGHAIECRINAEDAARKFAPTPGRITHYLEPAGPGVRIDSGVGAGDEISPAYDPMVAKLITWDVDREQATRRMLRALGEYEIGGLTTLIPFHRALLATEQWARGETCRDLLEDNTWLKATAPDAAKTLAPGGEEAEEAEEVSHAYTVEVSGRRFEVSVTGPPASVLAAAGAANGAGPAGDAAAGARKAPRRGERSSAGGGGPDTLTSPLQGNLWKVLVKQGDKVQEGQLLVIIEAMKMENEITAHKSGVIADLAVSEGAPIAAGDPIATITAES